MKKWIPSIIGAIIAVVLAGLWVADAQDGLRGYRIVWTQEVQTPEAQKALKDYVEHCEFYLWPSDAKAAGEGPMRVRPYCNVFVEPSAAVTTKKK